MPNSDASIDPLLRSIASSTSNFHSDPPLTSSSANSYQPAIDYDQTPYLSPQHLHNAGTINADINTSHEESSFNDPKRLRACEACRGLKVRCEPDQHNPDAPCKRCAKANRICVVTAPSRKRRKKTDSRVAELEKKIDALTASLAAQRAEGIFVPQDSISEYVPDSLHATSHFRKSLLQQTSNENYGSSFVDRTENNIDVWPSYSKSEINPKTNEPSKAVAGKRIKHTETFAAQSDVVVPVSTPSKKRPGISEGWAGHTYPTTPPNEYKGVIDRGLITTDIAYKIFDDFIENMVPLMPIVAIPPGTTGLNVHKSTPILFLAILSAGSSINYPHLQKPLTNEVMSIYAERIICNGEKSLELIQAIQISTLWFWLPDYFEEIRFYQLTHLGLVMAIDMGLGQKMEFPRRRPNSLFNDTFHPRFVPTDPESLEARRAWLSCYWLCCNASMTLRRPSLVRWRPFNDDCIDFLKKSPDALPSDKILCDWVTLQHIAEEVGVQFSMHDPYSSVSIADTNVQHSLKNFEKDLEKWQVNIESRSMTRKLINNFFYASV